jgi:protein O-mannosyl-transferase
VTKKGRAAVRARESAATPGQPFSWLSHRVPVAVALVALNLFIYAAVSRFQLVNWDDSTYVTENPTVLGGLSWSSAWWALTTGHSPYWHPLTWLSHLLDVTLFGTDAGMYHVTSLLLHIGNTLLVFELFRRLTGAGGRSAFVAAIFAAHPLHVESVAWIAERKDVLSTFFWLLTMLAYAGYVRDRSWRRYAVMLVLYALALMSKPMVVTLPAVLLLLDIWPLRRVSAPGVEGRREETWTRLVMEKVPLFALALATSVATVVIQHRVGAMAGLDALPWTVRAANATIGYVAYLWKTIWPTHLAAFYPLFTISPARVGAAAAVIIAVTAAVLAERRRRPYLLTGWAWYAITIAPVIGLLQAGEQGMADRFMYIPMIGILVMAAWGLPELLETITVRRSWLLPAGASVMVAACAIASRAQTAHWEDSVTLWQHATRVTPESYIAHENLGQALRERGRLDEAEASYERAIVHAPPRSPAYLAVIHNSLGMVLTRKDKPREALEHFAAAVRLNPAFAEAQSNLGNAYVAAGRWPEAIEHYREAVHLKPDYTEPRVGLGGALLKQGRAAEAIPEYREALRLDPALAEAHNGLGAALATEGHDAEAMTEYTEALRLKPDLPTAHLNVAVLLVKRGDLVEARRHLERALAIDPSYTPAIQALRAIGAQGE